MTKIVKSTPNLREMTFGYELELGDVLRSRELPDWMGSWEYAETDIVNIHPPHEGVACDPLGTHPPVGGEINILPGRSPREVADLVSRSIEWFREQGDNPSASCVNHGHVHVRVPRLRDDVNALRRLTSFIRRNQHLLIEHCYQYKEHPLMKETRTARTYLKWDGGRPMPDWMCENVQRAIDFDDFIRLQCCGKDATSRGRPFRYAVNTYCLKHIDTIEFRCFRATLDYQQILNSLLLAAEFISRALSGDEDYTGAELAARDFAPLVYDHDHYSGWERTKWDKSRGSKQRRLVDVN